MKSTFILTGVTDKNFFFTILSFLVADAIFLAFTVSISSGEVKSMSFVLFLILRPLRLVTPPRMSPSKKKKSGL